MLYDTHCQTPDPKHGLSLYFRGTDIGSIILLMCSQKKILCYMFYATHADSDECIGNPCTADRVCVDGVNDYSCV